MVCYHLKVFLVPTRAKTSKKRSKIRKVGRFLEKYYFCDVLILHTGRLGVWTIKLMQNTGHKDNNKDKNK